jgi:CheY-like chemotaxis protein
MVEQSEQRHVLILSDAEDIHALLRELLEDEGYRVSSLPYLTGDMADVTAQTPDAILIDCNRMELDGSVAFLRSLRSHAHMREIPIVACTSAVRLIDAYRPQIDELRLRVVPKPFDINDLAAVMAESLSGRSCVTP